MKSWSLIFATQMLFMRSESELFDTFKNIILLRIFSLQNIYSWTMLRKLKWQIPGEPLAARHNWYQVPVPGRGPAVEKHWFRGSQVFHADGQTHMTKLTLTILNLADAPKTEKNLKIYSLISLFFRSSAKQINDQDQCKEDLVISLAFVHSCFLSIYHLEYYNISNLFSRFYVLLKVSLLDET